jgi:glutamate-5-semialdehyde dehydrogenase
VILKGGTEAAKSLEALHQTIKAALSETRITADAVQLIFSRDQVTPLLKLDRYIDMVIPRGSNALVRHIQENTRIPGKLLRLIVYQV